jgi:transcriptional regulator with XRE-family HTH domain
LALVGGCAVAPIPPAIIYTHLQKIEAGRKRPSTDVILKLASLFGVTADQLMRDDLDLGTS